VLGLERVGVRDNFFLLGGHSFLAVRVMAHIERRLGVKLPVVRLFRAPTIELLAGELDGHAKSGQWSPLVSIQSGGDAPPFFCVHPGGGNVLCYAELAAGLGDGRPFYGLQARGLEEGQEPLERVEEMAALYLEAVRGVQPSGPYFLGGWSLGGVVAFEMARRLEARGEEVALLALLDTNDPTAPARQAPEDFTSIMYSFARDLGLPLGELKISRRRFERLGRDEKLAYVLERAKGAGCVPAEIGPAQMGNLLRVFESNVRALRAYEAREFGGRVTYFRAGESGGVRAAATGWEGLAAGGVEVQVVPGDHYRMLRAPQVGFLSERLRVCLEAAATAAWGRG
jgi:thioesterase domain-containing protein